MGAKGVSLKGVPFYRQVEVDADCTMHSSDGDDVELEKGDKLTVVGCPHDVDKGTLMRVVVLSKTRGEAIKCLADLDTSVNGTVLDDAPKVRGSEDGTYTFPEKSLTSLVQGAVASIPDPCEPQSGRDEWATDLPPVRTPLLARRNDTSPEVGASEPVPSSAVGRWFTRTVGKVKDLFQ